MKRIAGIDEAGRGSVAGPVVAAAVLLPVDFDPADVDDSKKLSPQQRLERFEKLITSGALVGIGMAGVEEIDRWNILRATFRAMHRAVSRLPLRPAALWVDGPHFHPFPDIPHRCVIRGDALEPAISAASIVAKVWRDRWMERLHVQYPHYQWHQNKGYLTPAHLEAIRRYGPSPYHRRSFHIRALAPSLFPEGR